MQIILGISAYYHDSAAALLVNGVVVAAAHEERFTRKKQDAAYPANAIKYVLQAADLQMEDVDAVVFYEKPFIKFERLLENFHAFAPKGFRQFLMAIPVWIKEKFFLRKIIRDELNKMGTFKGELLFPEHHLSHAASAFYPSPFEDAAVLTIDGVGEWATSMIGYGKGKDITVLRSLNFPHSVGLLYSAFTYYLGFRVNSGEYKLMGLAPYGNVDSAEYSRFRNAIEQQLVDIRTDGSILLNMSYFKFATGLTMTNDKKWEQLLGMERRQPEAELDPHHATLALAIQHVTQDIVLRMAARAKKLTKSDNLVMAGGVALNCVANNALRKEKIFKNVWVQPAAGDAGGALGAALAGWHIYQEEERKVSACDFNITLGPEYSDVQVESVLSRSNATYEVIEAEEELAAQVAGLITEGKVVGWFQGRMEFGPRALGYRSILADPRSPEMQKRLNLKIKFREGFRPFAPAMLEEEAEKYFENGSQSPYMLFVDELKDQYRIQYPEESKSWSWSQKLYFERSALPAVTHIDYTARVQTVSELGNPLFHKLLLKMKELTGVGMVINTSFNVRGEPIVCSPEDAWNCFMKTEMDVLVMKNYIITKKEGK